MSNLLLKTVDFKIVSKLGILNMQEGEKEQLEKEKEKEKKQSTRLSSGE